MLHGDAKRMPGASVICRTRSRVNVIVTSLFAGVDFKWKQVERENRKLKIQVRQIDAMPVFFMPAMASGVIVQGLVPCPCRSGTQLDRSDSAQP